MVPASLHIPLHSVAVAVVVLELIKVWYIYVDTLAHTHRLCIIQTSTTCSCSWDQRATRVDTVYVMQYWHHLRRRNTMIPVAFQLLSEDENFWSTETSK